MAKAKKVAKTLAKAASTSKAKKIEPTYPGPEPGSIVWVRWSVGEYKIAVLVRYTNTDKPVCRIARVDRNGRYTGESFGTERTFEPGEVSRVFHERDWDAIGKGESVADVDARMARGPKVDARGKERDDQPKIGGRNVIDVDDPEAAYDVAQLILDDRSISAGTLRNLARWTLTANDLLEEWKSKFQRLEDDAHDTQDERDVAVAAVQSKPPVARKGDIVSIKYGKEWEPAVVAFIDANEMIFDTVDGNSGSRMVADEGSFWVLAPENVPGTHRGQRVENVARAAFDDYVIEHAKRKKANRRPSGEPIAPHIRGNDYCRANCGETCQLYQGAEFRDPPAGATPTIEVTPDERMPMINVRVGRAKWEGVHVTSVTSNLVGFTAGDGATGTRPWSTLGKDWNIASLPATFTSIKPVRLRADTVQNVMNDRGHDPVLVELHRQLALEMLDADETAKSAEGERKKVERQGKRALRKATGTKEPSPVERAVASSKCGARGPDGIVCIIDSGHGATTPVGKTIQHSNGPRTWTEALPKMVVTSERMGPPIEQPFIDEKPNEGLTLHQRNVAEAKRRRIPLWQLVEEQEAEEAKRKTIEAIASARSAGERDANEVADADELSVASDRELQPLGKERAPDGTIVDIAPMPWETNDVADDAPMPWEVSS